MSQKSMRLRRHLTSLSDDDSWVRLADLSGSAGFNVARMQRGRQLDILS